MLTQATELEARSAAERVEAVVSMSYKYAGFHSKMLKITQAAADAKQQRDALVQHVYTFLFNFLVARMNQRIEPGWVR